MTEHEMAFVMNFLYEHRAPALPASALAEVFDQLIWCTEDEGRALLKVRESWLRSDDRGRVEIGLRMNEVFAFADPKDMDVAFARIERKWPEFAGRCDEIRALRGCSR